MVAENKKISPFMVVFLIHPIQFGMSELWFDRLLVEDAGMDGWIGVIIAGFIVHILLMMIYSILNRGEGSAIVIHHRVFGKWAGGFLSLVLIAFFVSEGIAVIRSYAEIVEVFLLPGIEEWFVGLIVLALVYYAVTGGFRVVVGVCFWGFLIPFFMLTPVLIAPLQYDHFNNLLPIVTHPASDILQSAKDMTYAFLGFEGLLISYPFIQKPRSSQKWAHASNFFTMQFYLLITFITFAYFNKNLILKLIWPKLELVELTELPFLQGFQYVFISIWLLVILPNVTYAMWLASRAAKELFQVRQQTLLPIILIIIFAAVVMISDHRQITWWNHFVATFGFYFLILYVPGLWVAQRVKEKWSMKEKYQN